MLVRLSAELLSASTLDATPEQSIHDPDLTCRQYYLPLSLRALVYNRFYPLTGTGFDCTAAVENKAVFYSTFMES